MLIPLFGLPVFQVQFFLILDSDLSVRIDFKNGTYLSALVHVSTRYFHSQKRWWKPDGYRCGMCFQEACFHLPRNRQNRHGTSDKMLYSEHQDTGHRTLTYFEQF